MSKEHIVPIQEAATERINARKLQLPPYLNGKIGIDLEKTTRLMNIGGISHVFIENKAEDERSVPQIVGFDEQGTAYSGYAKSKTRNASGLETHDLQQGINTKGLEWRAMRIALDIEVITAGITQKEEGSLHLAEAWIKPLNSEVRNNIRKEGVSISLKPSRFILDYAADILSIYSAEEWISYTLSQEYVKGVVTGGVVLLLQMRKLENMFKFGYRSDLFYSTHIGRALWTTFRVNTAYRNLIVAMDKRNQD